MNDYEKERFEKALYYKVSRTADGKSWEYYDRKEKKWVGPFKTEREATDAYWGRDK